MGEKKEKSAADSHEWEVSWSQIRRAHGYSAPEENRKLFRQAHEAEELSREILKLSRDTLLLHLRFMEAALVRFVPGKELVTKEIATDGRFLYYNSVHVCRQFQKERGLPARDYLHIVFHCLFRHLFIGKKVIPKLWDLACDIAVENQISQLGIETLSCERQFRQKKWIDHFSEKVRGMTAERIYRYLRDEEIISPGEIEIIREDFYADDHQIWYSPVMHEGSSKGAVREENGTGRQEEETEGNARETGADEEKDGTGKEEPEISGNEKMEERSPGTGTGSGPENDKENGSPSLSPDLLPGEWEKLADRIRMDLETFHAGCGAGEGGLCQALGQIRRERI